MAELAKVEDSSRTEGRPRRSLARALRGWVASYSDPRSEGLVFFFHPRQAVLVWYGVLVSGLLPMLIKNARWIIFAMHAFPGYLLRLDRAARRPQGSRISDFGKLGRGP